MSWTTFDRTWSNGDMKREEIKYALLKPDRLDQGLSNAVLDFCEQVISTC